MRSYFHNFKIKGFMIFYAFKFGFTLISDLK